MTAAVRSVGGVVDLVRVVEDDAEVADPPDAGVHAGRRVARLDARVAEDALLGLAGLPVVVGLLVRARGDAHAPGAAHVLVDQHDAVLAALVDRARRAGGDAGRVETVVADARQIEERHPLELEHRLLLGGRQVLQVGVVARVVRRAAEVVVPVRPHLDVHRLPGDHRDGSRRGLVVHRRRLDQVEVLVGERLVVVVDHRQVRVVEDVEQPPLLARSLEVDARRFLLPPALVDGLVFPLAWDSRSRAWSRRCSTTCTPRPCGRSRCSCRRWSTCDSRCTCRDGRPSRPGI